MNATPTHGRGPADRRKTDLKTRHLKLGAPLLIVLALLYWGCGRWSTGSATGAALASPTTRPAPARLRLATFNIHSGVGDDGKSDLARTAEVLRGADVIALQEVAGGGFFGEDQATTLGRMLGMTAVFQPTEKQFWVPAFGNAVLTNQPMGAWTRTRLPNGYQMANRSMVHFTVPIGDKTLNVIAVHLGKSPTDTDSSSSPPGRSRRCPNRP